MDFLLLSFCLNKFIGNLGETEMTCPILVDVPFGCSTSPGIGALARSFFTPQVFSFDGLVIGGGPAPPV